MDLINSEECGVNEKSAENFEVISTYDVVELEQRFEYETNVTICNYQFFF